MVKIIHLAFPPRSRFLVLEQDEKLDENLRCVHFLYRHLEDFYSSCSSTDSVEGLRTILSTKIEKQCRTFITIDRVRLNNTFFGTVVAFQLGRCCLVLIHVQ